MPGENILVIAVDGLRAASLGAYGNTTFGTPALDQLAAESYLFDNAFAEAVDLPVIYRALWQPPRSSANKCGETTTSLPSRFNERGCQTTLIADDPLFADLPAAHDFTELVQLAASPPVRAEEISQTSLGRCFSAACDEIESSGPNRLIWLHSRGMYGPWDAPLKLQEPLLALEEGDPSPSEVVEPPDFVLDETHDADAAFRASCAYAAQAMVLDECIAAVCESIASSNDGRWLVVLLGVRGFPLGEHGRVGGVDDRLYVEQLHVPLLWRFPDGENRLARNAGLTTPDDLSPMLNAWLDGQRCEPPARDALLAKCTAGTAVIRTADWTLRLSGHSGEDSETRHDADAISNVELFVRPDDLWEANNVAVLCPDVVEELRRLCSEKPSRQESGENG